MGTVINSIGSAGRDFATLQAWADALPANLVTDGNSYVGQCYNDSEFTGTTRLLVLTGHNTDATHTITLTTGPGQSFRDNPNVQTNPLRYNSSQGVAITSSCSDGNSVIDITDFFVFISNIQIKLTGVTGASAINDIANTVISNCIAVRTALSGNFVIRTPGTIKNCLIHREGAGHGLWLSDGTGNAYFCTIATASDTTPDSYAILTSAGSTIENCAVFGFSSFSFDTTGTYITCMTDNSVSLPSGVTGGLIYANQFQNTTAASGDWRLKGGAGLLDVGTVDLTNGATDIAGTSRPQGSGYDIGAWEFIVSAVGLRGTQMICR